MVDYSEVRHLSPSILFFFAHLGAFLRSFGGCCPLTEGFILRDSNLGLVLADLYPLLHQSLNRFQSLREMSVEERIRSKVRSSELETGLSFSDDPIEAKTNTVTSVPSSSQPSSS